METKVKLLIVEDEDAQLNSWNAKIDFHNAEDDEDSFTIIHKQAKSLAEAEEMLAKYRFDAAIVDIRLNKPLGNVQGPNADGNQVLEKIMNSELAAVAIFSGEAALAAPPEWSIDDVKVFKKLEDGIDVVMNWLKQQVPMIKQIQSVQIDIQQEMAKLFSRSIWPRWSHWVGQKGNDEFIEQALTRHLTSHIYATFLEKGEHKVHPEEWYFIPPVQEVIRTGDLVKNDDGTIDVIITPRCDLAREGGTNETYQLVRCKDVNAEWNDLCETVDEAKQDLVANVEPGKIEKLTKKIENKEKVRRQYSQHKSNSSVYHFLPRMKLQDGTSIGPFFVQFDKLSSINRNEAGITADLKSRRFASMSPEFLPSLVERLGAFFSRIGSPDYSHPD